MTVRNRRRRRTRALFAFLLPLALGLVLYRAAAPDPPHASASETVQAFAAAHGLSLSDYPSSLLALLDRNPETEQFVLQYPLESGRDHPVNVSREITGETVPLFLQWDPRWGYLPYGDDVAGLTACGPVCLSMAAVYLTGDPTYAPDYMIHFAQEGGYCVPGKGSRWSLISEGAAQLGLQSEELPLDEATVAAHLGSDEPVICIMGPGDFTTTGHFIVLTGYDDGLVSVNDPNSRANSERLWDFSDLSDQIQNLWALRAA